MQASAAVPPAAAPDGDEVRPEFLLVQLADNGVLGELMMLSCLNFVFLDAP